MKKKYFSSEISENTAFFVIPLLIMMVFVLSCLFGCTNLKRKDFIAIETEFRKTYTPNDTKNIHIFKDTQKDYLFKKSILKQGWGNMMGVFRRYHLRDADGAIVLDIILEIRSDASKDIETHEMRYKWTMPNGKERNMDNGIGLEFPMVNGERVYQDLLDCNISKIKLQKKLANELYYNVELVYFHHKTKTTIKENFDIIVRTNF